MSAPQNGADDLRALAWGSVDLDFLCPAGQGACLWENGGWQRNDPFTTEPGCPWRREVMASVF